MNRDKESPTAETREDGRQQADDEVARSIEANRLYWGSEESVNRIADDLGLSKGSLYEIVQPLPSGLPCPRCGTEMAYPNRTAREKGFLSCPACQFEEDEGEVREAPTRDDVSQSPDRRIIAGAALLGMAVGLAIGSLIRK